MELHEIENLSAAEIKERRAELLDAAKSAPPDQLAARYVQARLDAKLRDETLGTQGITITSLNDALATAKEKIAAAEERAAAAESEVIAGREALKAAQAKAAADAKAAGESAVVLEERIRQLQQDLSRSQSLATSRRAALASVMEFAGQLNAKVAPLLVAE